MVLVVALLSLVAAPTAPASMRGIPGPLHVTVVHAPCPTSPLAVACADLDTATVYVEDSKDRFTVQHEVGHVFDTQRLNDRERGALARLLHSKVPWSAPGPQNFFDDAPIPAGEKFADAYAACRLGLNPDTGVWETGYDWYPTGSQQRHMCATIKRFA